MTLSRTLQRALIVVFLCVPAGIYAVAWFLPAIGLDHDDAAYLVTAGAMTSGHGYTIENLPHPIPQTAFPPFFPGLLALFALVSRQPQWLKALPLACAAGWLILTYCLLRKMGASTLAALLLVVLTALSPTVISLSTNLFPETTFALLVTAALLALLEERALLAGLFAGLAALTMTAGVALLAACIVTLVVRQRFRGAMIFAAVAMAITAPWFGWSLAQITHDASHSGAAATNIFNGLAASEKLVVLGRNVVSLLESPLSLLTGLHSVYFVVAGAVALIWCLWVRRQFLPDLFVLLYSFTLACLVSPPERPMAVVLPLIFWIVWRVLRLIATPAALAAIALIAAGFPIWADARNIVPARNNGDWGIDGVTANNWSRMRNLFGFIRANTASDDILLANLDGTLFLNTGRKTTRGFVFDAFDLFYSPRSSTVTPDRLLNTIVEQKVNYVVLTPDRGRVETGSFHRSVEALERGGVVDPVSVPGESPDYMLFKVVAHGVPGDRN
ncbi:MAG TPA: glycosyltransferase 87 family protein [Bryobacteraceae bacterium]|jgi:hypothetical protein|nr:glycosyltransferase 87 family protein [Bryobacteraceae bacterium]